MCHECSAAVSLAVSYYSEATKIGRLTGISGLKPMESLHQILTGVKYSIEMSRQQGRVETLTSGHRGDSGESMLFRKPLVLFPLRCLYRVIASLTSGDGHNFSRGVSHVRKNVNLGSE